jgi:hypothetical protein
VVLLPQISLESPLIATWEATSNGVRGVTRGTVRPMVGERPWSIGKALAEAGRA